MEHLPSRLFASAAVSTLMCLCLVGCQQEEDVLDIEAPGIDIDVDSSDEGIDVDVDNE